ncbi:MAG: universal stress protein [Candidatus Thorarchaeota archaeon]
MYKKILLGTDGSDYSLRAAQKVIELTKLNDTKVVAFHSVEHHAIPSGLDLGYPFVTTRTYEIPPQDYQRIREEYEVKGREVIEETERLFAEYGLDIEVRLVMDEDADDYITRIVKEEGFDLVVLGFKGVHSTLEKIEEFFSGSIAKKVFEKAPCDVLLIR